MLRRKGKEKPPDEWVLEVFQDICTDRAWDAGDVHVMVGKEAWMFMVFRGGRPGQVAPDPAGYPTWEDAVAAGLAGIKEVRDES